jgi:hypothetical protein
MQGHIILGDCNLRRYLDDLLSQIMTVFKSVDEGHLEVQTRIHLAIVLLETMNQACVLFSHEHDEAQVNEPLGKSNSLV